jgi:ABC-type amino acid transport substrate-binding protein
MTASRGSLHPFSGKALAALLSLSCLCAAAPARADGGGDANIRPAGVLKVAVYKDFAPFSAAGGGIDIDLAAALADKLGLTLSLLPFPAGEELGDDLRNMVWKGHYLGYGPADVMLHVPLDPRLAQQNGKVRILAPYYREVVRLVRDIRKLPRFDGLDAIAGKRIGVEKISISAMVLIGAENGKFRDDVHIFANATEALQKLKAGELDAVLATRSEIESVLGQDPNFEMTEVAFPRLPRNGWLVGMAVKQEEPQLAARLQAAVDQLTASGDMARLFAKHGVLLVSH